MIESKSISVATRALTTFLRITVEGGPPVAASKAALSLDYLPEGSGRLEELPWSTRKIFDIEGRLTFRDHVIELNSELEICVRAAASDVLGTPVWSVRAGRKFAYDELLSTTVKAGAKQFQPVLVEAEKVPRLIVYSYPRLGVLCESTFDSRRCIIDIGDQKVVYLNQLPSHTSPEYFGGIWSPFDGVNRLSLPLLRESWNRRLEALSLLPESGEIGAAVQRVQREIDMEERSVNPELVLVGQETPVFCAVATAQMILHHHGIHKAQRDIAVAMKTGETGTTNPDQLAGYALLSQNALDAKFDRTASFEEARREILENRPFKSGVPQHARAIGGFKIERDVQYLYVYDPWPPTGGLVYYEDWASILHTNYIYLPPRTFQ